MQRDVLCDNDQQPGQGDGCGFRQNPDGAMAEIRQKASAAGAPASNAVANIMYHDHLGDVFEIPNTQHEYLSDLSSNPVKE